MAIRLSRTIGARREQGYVLLTLLLVLALIAIAATAIAPGIVFQIKRDREEELVHRGIQYRRAVRLYVNKTGRYPVSLEVLQGNADARYIRKLYKDPITGGDFRMLHMGDVQPSVGPGTPIQPNQNGAVTDNASGDQPQAANPQQSTDSGQSPQTSPNPNPANPALSNEQTHAAEATAIAQSANTNTGAQPGLLIFGVASKSKDRTIREFNRKNHYNDWWFFYDARANAGYEVKGPTPPAGAAIPTQINQPGTPASAGQSPTTTQGGLQQPEQQPPVQQQ